MYLRRTLECKQQEMEEVAAMARATNAPPQKKSLHNLALDFKPPKFLSIAC